MIFDIKIFRILILMSSTIDVKRNMKKINRQSCIDGKLIFSKEDMLEFFDIDIDEDSIVLYFFTKCYGDYYNFYWCNKDETLSGKIKNLDIDIHFASCKCNKHKF